MGQIDKPFLRVMDAYQAAVHARDSEALMRLYDPAVRVFDAWGVWLYEGAEAWQRAVEGWFTSLGAERVQVHFDDVQTLADHKLAQLSAVVTYATLAADGAPLRSMQNRLSWTLRESGHVWRIVHEHTSTPVGFEDHKALLQRTAVARP